LVSKNPNNPQQRAAKAHARAEKMRLLAEATKNLAKMQQRKTVRKKIDGIQYALLWRIQKVLDKKQFEFRAYLLAAVLFLISDSLLG
jgi:hypothetical protein